jgi:hypothetical protein
MNWIPCTHQDVLPAGSYVLKIIKEGFTGYKLFEVPESQKEREIGYYNAKFYFKIIDE